jgi:hypothetical protein
MFEHQSNKRSIKLNLKGIQRIRGHALNAGEPSSKKAVIYMKEVVVSVDLGIHIKTSRDNGTSDGMVAWDGQVIPVFYGQAHLKGLRSTSGKELHVRTQKEISIPQRDLEQWSRGNDCRRQMLFHINFGDASNVKEMLEKMDWRGRAMVQQPSSRWVAEWPDISKPPLGGQLFLPLFYFARGKSITEAKKELPFGLQVSVEYITHPGPSVLAACIQQRKAELGSRRRPQQPTTIALSVYNVIYSWPNRLDTRYDGLICHHCPRMTFKDINELNLHLKGNHTNFRYTPKKESEVDTLVLWRFESEVAEQRADHKTSDDDEFVILAPRRPFDGKRYLENGDDSWQLQARRQKAKPAARKQAGSGPGAVRRGPNTREPPLRRRAPEEVADRPTYPETRKYAVPKAPEDVTFFRSFTKRPLVEGELIEESDDDIDMDWLSYKTDRSLTTDSNLTKKAKKLMLEWNSFIRKENLQSDYFFGDALIRFTREKKLWIMRELLDKEFRDFASQLHSYHAITDEILQGCIAILESAQLAIEESGETHTNDQGRSVNARVSKGNKGKGKAKVTDWAPPTPQSTDNDGDVEMRDCDASGPITSTVKNAKCGQCICGRWVAAHKGEKVIFCESLVSQQSSVS